MFSPVAGAAREHPIVLVVGLVLSVALMGVAANVIAQYIERYRWIAYVGLAVILYVARQDDLGRLSPDHADGSDDLRLSRRRRRRQPIVLAKNSAGPLVGEIGRFLVARMAKGAGEGVILSGIIVDIHMRV